MQREGTRERAARRPMPSAFRKLLVNTLVTAVTSTFLWFALTFWVYLETRSVVATGVIGGAFALSSAVIGPVFGTFVDRHRKKTALVLTTATALASFVVASGVYVIADPTDLPRLTSPWFWLLLGSTLFGSVAGQMRGIVLSTCVTLLVEEDQRDRANGMLGTTTGFSFAITSAFSGLVVGGLGMGWAYAMALALTLVALVHMLRIAIPEGDIAPATEGSPAWWSVDVHGAVEAIRSVPGLTLLIYLAAFNNLVAGVFMALTDAYGLMLVSVGTWGLLFGFFSFAFVAGGLFVARWGLGPHPIRVVLAGNLINWAVCSVLAVRSSIVLLSIGMLVWFAFVPVVEAAEQTILQRTIPFERQGRVFGFAQLIENAATPLTAFLMAPLAEIGFIPLMTEGRGVDWIGSWFGTGPDRGLGLMFTLSGIIGVIVTLLAWSSTSYRRLRGDRDEVTPPLVTAEA